MPAVLAKLALATCGMSSVLPEVLDILRSATEISSTQSFAVFYFLPATPCSEPEG